METVSQGTLTTIKGAPPAHRGMETPTYVQGGKDQCFGGGDFSVGKGVGTERDSGFSQLKPQTRCPLPPATHLFCKPS